MKFTAAGDAIIQKRIFKDFDGFGELAPFISQGDARFFNLETTVAAAIILTASGTTNGKTQADRAAIKPSPLEYTKIYHKTPAI